MKESPSAVQIVEGNTSMIAPGDDHDERGGVKDLGHAWKLQAREPGDPNGLLEEVISSGQKTPPEVMLTKTPMGSQMGA